MNLEISNPHAFSALRVSTQARSRNTFEKSATPAPAALKLSTRAELEIRGRAVTVKSTRISTRHGSEMRDCEVPAFQSLGYASIEEYCTEIAERELRASQQAITAAPTVQRVSNCFGESKGFASIAPGAKVNLPMDEGTRYLVACDDDVTLQIQNQSMTRTLRLKNHTEAGDVHVAFVAPAQVSIVIAGRSAAIIELQST